ncbi:hypothetical protein CJ195_09045 [Bacillus sp. UMB0899]|nr:hypothetical protein CJ195_09045 [Bacillus sp. UMB0899]
MIGKWYDTKFILMNSNTMKQLNFKENQLIPINYGNLTIVRALEINENLDDETIGLSKHFTEEVTFPTDVKIEVQIKNNEIHLGPLIGMLLVKNHEKLTTKVLEHFKERIPSNETGMGVVFVGSQDWIDDKRKLIRGYYYSVLGEWKEGIFPFPKVLYNRTYIKKSHYKRLKKSVDMKVFNNCLMTKSKLWRLLRKDPSVNMHLPYTQTLRDLSSFIAMINHFNTVYLKPTNLSRGRGIYKVEKLKLGYLIRDTNNQEKVLFTEQELEKFITSLTKNRNYIIQQGVPYMFGKSLVDFRVYMQKDETKNWNCSGIYGRVSKPNRVITNLKHSQEILTIDLALKRFFQLQKSRRLEIQQEMIQVCKNVCTALEEKNQILADVAIDVVVDKQMKVWVLEVQVSYAADERLYQLPKSIYKKVWQTPYSYAKALTGF